MSDQLIKVVNNPSHVSFHKHIKLVRIIYAKEYTKLELSCFEEIAFDDEVDEPRGLDKKIIFPINMKLIQVKYGLNEFPVKTVQGATQDFTYEYSFFSNREGLLTLVFPPIDPSIDFGLFFPDNTEVILCSEFDFDDMVSVITYYNALK